MVLSVARGNQMLTGQLEDAWRRGLLSDLTDRVRQDADLLSDAVKGLDSDSVKVRYGCAEIISRLSENSPKRVYPFVERIIANLEAEERCLKWEAVCTVGNLARVDNGNRVCGLSGSIAKNLGSDDVLLKVHTIRALGKLGRAFPDERQAVFGSLAKAVAELPPESKGFAFEGLFYLAGYPDLKPKIRKLAKPYLHHPLKPLRAKAQRAFRRACLY